MSSFLLTEPCIYCKDKKGKPVKICVFDIQYQKFFELYILTYVNQWNLLDSSLLIKNIV